MVDVEHAFRRGKKYEWVLTKPSALLQAKTVQWTAAKINLNIFSLRDVGEASEEEIAFANIKLFSKNHWFLWVEDNGDVSGTQVQGYEVTLQLQSFGNSLVRIYSPKMGRFIAMDSNGRLFSTKNKTDSTIFKHVKEMNGFHTFSSHKYYRETPHDMYIALQKDGIPRKGNKTCRLHKGSQFLII